MSHTLDEGYSHNPDTPRIRPKPLFARTEKRTVLGASTVIYVLFAAIVFLVHGPEPELNIDHIAYFKSADDIMAQHPDGQYWRSVTSLQSYPVLMAYLHKVTGSHILTLKYLLAVMTIAYLLTFSLLMSLFTDSWRLRLLFSVLSALFVSFGASFWGFTDFSASLNRSIVLPLFVLAIAFFLRFYHTPWRYGVFPALVLLSVLHLSAYHLLLVLLVFEGLDFTFRRHARPDHHVVFLVLALLVSYGIKESLEISGMGYTHFVGATLQAAGAAAGQAVQTTQKVWEIELYAFPWRNLPLPFTTIANMALSFGFIFLLATCGTILAYRRGARRMDQLMLLFALAVFLASYGLQSILWVARNLVPINPINFEEMRAINLLMIPAVYFTFRLFQAMGELEGRRRTTLARLAVIAAFMLQPILLIRSLPAEVREKALAFAADGRLLMPADTLRMVYARHYLGLATEGRRFYYSTLPLIEWLKRNGRPDDLILTDRNEIALAGYPVVGTFQRVVKVIMATDPARVAWRNELETVCQALSSGNTEEVVATAKRYDATIAIVPWSVDGADYRDENFSILRFGS